MKVLKFGGSSVGSPEMITRVIDIIRPYLQDELALVCSAFGGVTDQLIHISTLALQGNKDYETEFVKLSQRHVSAVKQLLPVQGQSTVLTQLTLQLNELEEVLNGVFLVKERTLRSLDYIMSFGERLSAYIISEALNARGINAEYTDARKLIRTDNSFGAALVDFEVTNRLIQDHFRNTSRLQVITGFIASSESGETTTLGRSGSDYTASIIAAALRAEQLEIWTDVDGIMTANPRLVKQAFTIPELSYEEAMELSHFGAKVIFPATMRPAMNAGIPIRIKNTFNPEHPGTLIRSGIVNGKMVKGISSIDNISLLNIQGSGMVGVVGISARLFEALAKEKVNVILISQASSEHSICIAVETSQGRKAQKAIEQEFRHELREKLIDAVHLTDYHSIIAVVGDGMKHHPGTSGRMFSALGKNGVNVVAIAQGSSERNISAVISQSDTAKAVAALHDAFFLSENKTVHLFIAGTGLIGSTLLRQICQHAVRLAQENKLEIRLIGLSNSRKMIVARDTLNPDEAISVLMERGEPADAGIFCRQILELNLPNSIFVDCTASDEVAALYLPLLTASVSVVTANKKANSGPYERYNQLKKARNDHGVFYLYETNVSAGLPVISTLNDLLLSGDTIIRIEAVLSGTLNFIFSSISAQCTFSQAVARARALGFTEPDPRDDLSGMDVGRKMLILAREAGLKAEPEELRVENLVPEDCRGPMDVETLLGRLKQHDEKFEDQRKKAEAENSCLRYVAVLENGQISVGLRKVPATHPFYSLSGSDNMLQFTTERYNERPMIIRGPGAGAEVTAAGVFSDIIRIGNHVR